MRLIVANKIRPDQAALLRRVRILALTRQRRPAPLAFELVPPRPRKRGPGKAEQLEMFTEVKP